MAHKIEWCTHTENPFHGCLHGCSYCYARRMAWRLSHIPGNDYSRLKSDGVDPFEPTFNELVFERLQRELWRTKKPRRIFLGSMGDLGGNWLWNYQTSSDLFARKCMLPIVAQNKIKEFIAENPHHIFLILTKNPKGLAGEWPENAHVGVSVSHTITKREIQRIQLLLKDIKAGVRWVSVEPLMDPHFDSDVLFKCCLPHPHEYIKQVPQPDWVVIGGLSGKPPQPEIQAAARRIIRAAENFNVPVFCKKNIRDNQHDWPMDLPS